MALTASIIVPTRERAGYLDVALASPGRLVGSAQHREVVERTIGGVPPQTTSLPTVRSAVRLVATPLPADDASPWASSPQRAWLRKAPALAPEAAARATDWSGVPASAAA